MQDEQQQFYPVLQIGLGDFEDKYFDEEECDEITVAAYKERLEFARNMSPDQWRELAESIGNMIFDGDRWDDALSYAIDNLMSYEGTTGDAV